MFQTLNLFSLVYIFNFSIYLVSFCLDLESLSDSPSVKVRIFLTFLTLEYSPEDFPLLQTCPLRVTAEQNFSSVWSIP